MLGIIRNCFELQMKDHAFEQCLDDMRQCMGPAKLREISNENFTDEWSRMKNVSQGFIGGRSYAAKDCLPKPVDEMTTEINDGDIVRALRRQMGEMNNHMNAIVKMNKEAIRERCGGLGAFGTTNVAIASGRVDLLVPPVLPAANAFTHHYLLKDKKETWILVVGTPTAESCQGVHGV